MLFSQLSVARLVLTSAHAYLMSMKMNLFRIPVRWDRLQRSLFTALDIAEMNRLDSIVNYATSKGAWVVIDPHHYGKYMGNFISSTAVPNSAFADFW